jgi:hypothetical protein
VYSFIEIFCNIILPYVNRCYCGRLCFSSMLPPPTATSEAPQLVTVEEAIESFRKNIIRKETEIAGIIESDHPFYRHFRLEYGDNIVIHIRCTYEANYAEQAL